MLFWSPGTSGLFWDLVFGFEMGQCRGTGPWGLCPKQILDHGNCKRPLRLWVAIGQGVLSADPHPPDTLDCSSLKWGDRVTSRFDGNVENHTACCSD